MGTLASCTRFYFTGNRTAWSCGDVKQCFAQIQLSPAGGSGSKYWLLDHACGSRSTIVPDGNTDCIGGIPRTHFRYRTVVLVAQQYSR